MSNQNPSFGDDDTPFGWEISQVELPPPVPAPQRPQARELTLPVDQPGVAAEKNSGSFRNTAVFVGGLVVAFGASYLISNAALSSNSTGAATTEAAIQPEGPSEGIASTSDSNSGSNPDSSTGLESDEQDALTITSDSIQPSDPGAAATIPSELLESVEPTEENPTGAVRYAIYRDDRIYLRGLARDEEAVERLVASFGSVFGANNVIDEYELDAASPRWTEAPIYFADAVLFDVDSAEIRTSFYPLLEQTSRLVELGPFVTIRVVAMTDASGSEEYNRALAQRRADSVVEFYVEELGIDEIRFEADVLGEQRATVSADGDTAASERRVELIVSGIRG